MTAARQERFGLFREHLPDPPPDRMLIAIDIDAHLAPAVREMDESPHAVAQFREGVQKLIEDLQPPGHTEPLEQAA